MRDGVTIFGPFTLACASPTGLPVSARIWRLRRLCRLGIIPSFEFGRIANARLRAFFHEEFRLEAKAG